MNRYRILWDLDAGEDAQPCGVVIEREDCVEIIAPADKGFPRRVTEPCDGPLYPDLSYPTYVPGDPKYFDLTCFDLHRSFAMTGEFCAAPVPPSEEGPAARRGGKR